MATTIGRAVIVVSADSDPRRIQREIEGGLTQAGVAAGDKAGKQTGWTFARGVAANVVSNVLTKAASAAGNLASKAFSLGFGRLVAIDDARGSLRGLGHDAASIDTIMTSALNSVKGTAFGLGDAATLAATAVASGIKPGIELTNRLKLTGDAATIARTSLGDMGSIFGKVTTQQRAYTMELNMLADRGIPIYQWLQDELGVSADALRKMVADGAIDSETFFKVIQKNIGGAALEAGTTFSGSLENVKAAIGRLGAAFLEPIFQQMPGVFAGIIASLDGVAPAAESVGAALGGAFTGGVNALGQLGAVLAPLGGAFADLWAVVGPLAADLGQLAVGALAVGWQVFLGVVKAVVPVIVALAGFLRENEEVVRLIAAALIGGIAAFKTYQAVVAITAAVQHGYMLATYGAVGATYAVGTAQKLGAAIGQFYALVTTRGALAAKAAAAGQWILNAAMAANPIGLIVVLIGALVAALIYAWNNSETFRRIVTGAWEGIKVAVGAVVGWFTDVVAPFFVGLWDSIAGGDGGGPNILIRAWEGIKDFFQGLWDGIVAGVTWFVEGVVSLFLRFHPLGLIISHWEPIVAFFTGLWQRVSGAILAGLGAIWTVIEPWVAWFMGVFQAAWGVLQFLIVLPIRLAQIAIVAAWNGIVAAFQWAVDWVGSVFAAIWAAIGPPIIAVITTVRDGIAAAWTAITGFFAAAWAWIAGVFMASWNSLTVLIGAVMDAVSAWVSRVWTAIIGFFTAAWTWIATVFMVWYNTLAPLVGAVMDAVAAWISRVWTAIIGLFTAAWTWVSGTFMVWWNQLTSLMETPIRLAGEAIGRILDGIRAAFQGAVDFIKDVWDRIPGIVRAPVELAIRIGNALIGGFRTVARAVGLDDIAGKLVDIPPLPAMKTGGRTDDIVPGSRSFGVDSTMGVLSDGMPWVRVDPGEALVRRDAVQALDQQYGPSWLDTLNRGRLPGYFQGGRMPTTAGAVNPHGQPYHGTRYAADMPRPVNTPVYAWHAGTVAQIQRLGTSYGHNIVINHAPNIGRSRYAHLQPGSMAVAVGQQVAQGARIAGVDSTGNSTGHHLHFEIIGGNQPISATGTATGEAASIVDWVGDLLGQFAGPLRELASIGDHPVGAIVKKIPNMVAEGLIEKVREAAAAMMDTAGASAPGVPGAPLSGLGVTANTAAKGGEIAATTRAAGHTISNIGGYRGDGEHVTRRALDFMVPNRASGDFLSNFVLGNRGRYGLQHVIWWQRINSGTGWRGMADRGSPTQNHMDHPHVLFNAQDLPLDTGGMLPTGLNLTRNDTGQPEPVLTGAQWDNVEGILTLLDRQVRTETASKRGEINLNATYAPVLREGEDPKRQYEAFMFDFVDDVAEVLNRG